MTSRRCVSCAMVAGLALSTDAGGSRGIRCQHFVFRRKAPGVLRGVLLRGGGTRGEEGDESTGGISPSAHLDLGETRRPYIQLHARTDRTGDYDLSQQQHPLHVRFMQYLMLDALLALQTFISIGFLVNAIIFAVTRSTIIAANAPSSAAAMLSRHQAIHLRTALLAAIVRYSVEFARGCAASGLNLRRDGITGTRQKVATLARSPACKYAFFALFFLVLFSAAGGGAAISPSDTTSATSNVRLAALCLVPLVAREVVWLGWSVRDAFQWMQTKPAANNDSEDGSSRMADGEQEWSTEEWVINTLRSAAGFVVGLACSGEGNGGEGGFASLNYDAQARLLSRRLFQLNVAAEALVVAETATRVDFPSPLHRAAALYALLRIILAEFWSHPMAFLAELTPFVRPRGGTSDDGGKSVRTVDDDDDDDDGSEDSDGDDSAGDSDGGDSDGESGSESDDGDDDGETSGGGE